MLRIIGHLDLDAFFAAVEERDKEWLRGKPVVVGADPEEGKGRGVVSTANYKAREYGIRSGIPISTAWRMSELAVRSGKPAAAFVGVRGKRYREASDSVMSVVRNHVPVTEQAGIDEIYLDFSFTRSFRKAREIAVAIKRAIENEEQLTCSVGIGPNKLIAKVASDFQKPNGLTIVQERNVLHFLELLPTRSLPGIGPKTELYLQRRGIQTVGDLRKFSRNELFDRIGKWGVKLYDRARGRDDEPVEETHEIKSMGEQETLPQDTDAPRLLLPRLESMCGRVFERLKANNFAGFRTAVVTVRFGNFETASRSRTFASAVLSSHVLTFEAMRLLMPFLDGRENPRKQLIRLVGVRVEKLV